MDFVPRQTFCRIVKRHQSNAAIEDLAFMLEASGVKTGNDITKLLALGQLVIGWLAGEQTNGTLCGAGLPKTSMQPFKL